MVGGWCRAESGDQSEARTRLFWPIRGLGVRRQVFVWSGVLLLPCQGVTIEQNGPIRGKHWDKVTNKGPGICPVSSTVKLNAEMTEWRVLLQKNLNIKVAKTHIWLISEWAVVNKHKCSFIKVFYLILRTSPWLIDGFVKRGLSILLIKVGLTVLLINEYTNWNDCKGIDCSLSKIPRTG